MTPSAYPLSWPHGWHRSAPGARRPTTFRHAGRPIALPPARDRLQAEMDRLGTTSVVLSTNLELRLDGQPRAGRAEPADPGAAVYFQLRARPTVLACDTWSTVAGNIAAIAAHIEALRGQPRWGVGTVEQAFTGYAALPAPIAPDDWRGLLSNPATLAQAQAAWREAMKQAHPDRGGSTTLAAALNAAIVKAREVLR